MISKLASSIAYELPSLFTALLCIGYVAFIITAIVLYVRDGKKAYAEGRSRSIRVSLIFTVAMSMIALLVIGPVSLDLIVLIPVLIVFVLAGIVNFIVDVIKRKKPFFMRDSFVIKWFLISLTWLFWGSMLLFGIGLYFWTGHVI